MKKMELIAPCHFGLEAVLKREITELGYEIAEVEDGRVTFYGDADALCRANVFLRTAERILLKVGSFTAVSFEELFEKTRRLPWEEYIPKNGRFWVAKAASVKSKLFSPSDIQAHAGELSSRMVPGGRRSVSGQGVFDEGRGDGRDRQLRRIAP